MDKQNFIQRYVLAKIQAGTTMSIETIIREAFSAYEKIQQTIKYGN